MSAKNPRINVVFEKPIYEYVYNLAHREKVSLSMKVRDLVREAIEIYEDRALAKFAEEREKVFDRKKALTHNQVWKHLKKD